MKLEAAIQDYIQKRATCEAGEVEHQDLKNNKIPQAEKQLASAAQQLQLAENAHRGADTMETLQASKQKVRQAEELVQDAEMLLKNLRAKLDVWPREKIQVEAQYSLAAREMWSLKKADLLERLSLSPELVQELEYIVATDFGITGGYRTYSLGDATDFKYGNMAYERIQEVNSELLNQMVESVS